MKEILVYANWKELPNIMQMGILRAQVSKGEEIFSFEYSKDWLEMGFAQDINPDLKIFTGPQCPNDEKPNFGIFLDSSQDRWGRMLMKRRAAIIAREVGVALPH